MRDSTFRDKAESDSAEHPSPPLASAHVHLYTVCIYHITPKTPNEQSWDRTSINPKGFLEPREFKASLKQETLPQNLKQRVQEMGVSTMENQDGTFLHVSFLPLRSISGRLGEQTGFCGTILPD